MTAANRWTTYLALPLAVLFETAGYYAMRSVLTLHIIEGGGTYEDTQARWWLMNAASLAATVLGGLVAIGTGPWIVVAVGALGTALAMAALGVFPAELALLPAVAVAFAHGFLRPAVYGAAAQAFRKERGQLRDSAFYALWGSVNAAAFAGPLLGGQLRESLGPVPVFFVAAALVSTALVLALGGTIVSFVSRPKTPEKMPFRAAPVGIAVAIAAVGALVWASYGATSDLLYSSAPELAYGETFSWLYSLNPVAVTVLSLVGATVFGVLHLLKVRIPTLAIAGVGAVVIAAAGTVALSATTPPITEAGLLGAIAILSIGEALFAPLLLSRATGDLPARLETAIVAVWLTGGQIQTMLLAAIGRLEGPSRGFAWVGVVVAFLLGIALSAAAFALRKVLGPPLEEPEEARTTA